MKTTKVKEIKHEDLLIRIFTGKYGDYKYRSPYYGYKWAYRYNKVVYIYIDGHFDDGYIDTLYFKNCTNASILEYITGWKTTSRHYKKAISIQAHGKSQ